MASGLLAVLRAGAMLALLQAPAHAGGLVAGHATFGHSDLGRGEFRFGDFHRFGGRPFVRSGHVPSLSRNPAAVYRLSGWEPGRHHHRFFGVGLPINGIGVWFGPFDQPLAEAAPIDRPAGADGFLIRDGGDRIAVNRGGCRSESRIVPSENGGERPIRITWCRKG